MECGRSDGMSLLRLGYSRHFRGPHDKELKPPANSHVSELGSESLNPSQVFRGYSPCWQLNCKSRKTLNQNHPANNSQVPVHQKICEIINVCCFKLLNFGAICYAEIDNEYSSSPGCTWPRFSELRKLDGNPCSVWEQDDPTRIHDYFQIKKVRLKWISVEISYQM